MTISTRAGKWTIDRLMLACVEMVKEQEEDGFEVVEQTKDQNYKEGIITLKTILMPRPSPLFL